MNPMSDRMHVHHRHPNAIVDQKNVIDPRTKAVPD
jgi:hypothetical protein